MIKCCRYLRTTTRIADTQLLGKSLSLSHLQLKIIRPKRADIASNSTYIESDFNSRKGYFKKTQFKVFILIKIILKLMTRKTKKSSANFLENSAATHVQYHAQLVSFLCKSCTNGQRNSKKNKHQLYNLYVQILAICTLLHIFSERHLQASMK